MRMEAHLSHRLEQRMKLAPQIIQSIEILQLPILELQETVKAELLENPTLEVDEEQEEHDVAKGIEQPTALGATEDPEAPKDAGSSWRTESTNSCAFARTSRFTPSSSPSSVTFPVASVSESNGCVTYPLSSML